MKRYALIYAPEAQADLLHLYEQIATAADPVTAMRYLDRIEAFCATFDYSPKRGTRRDDVRPGLRIIGFERRVTVAFTVETAQVVFLRFFYGGRDWERLIEG